MEETKMGDMLYLLPISPWSRRVLLALRHTQSPAVEVREYRVFLTSFILRFLGKLPRGAKVTAPLLLPRNGEAVMDGCAIARLLDATRAPGVATLFPPEHEDAVTALVQAAETMARYWRGCLFKYLNQHADLCSRLYVPAGLRWVPGSRHMALSVNQSLISKYGPETEAAERGMHEALQLMERAVDEASKLVCANAEHTYLVGGALTYADFAVALALPFVHPPSSHWQGVPDFPIGDRYPRLRQWGYKFCAHHVRIKDVAFPPPRFE